MEFRDMTDIAIRVEDLSKRFQIGAGKVPYDTLELPLAPGRYAFNLYSTVGGEMADWVQQAGYLNVAAGDYFGTGQLRTHDEGFVVKHRWTVKPHAG